MKRSSLGWLGLVVLVAGVGCGDEDPIPQQMVESVCEMPTGACDLTACAPEQLEAQHVDTCSSIDWPTNPPTSGQHFPIWASFQDYTEPVPWGFGFIRRSTARSCSPTTATLWTTAQR